MNKPLLRRSERLYRLLLQLYPRKYRQEFGDEMMYVFSESLKDAYKDQGDLGVISVWIRTITDTGKSVLTEYLDNPKGGESMKSKIKNKDLLSDNKVFLWIAGGAAALLTLPYMAMQFHWVKPDPLNPSDRGVDWSVGDFIIMGLLLFGAGSLFVFIARSTPRKYRVVVGVGVLAAFLLIWAHLAVGIVDSWPLAGS